MSIHTERFTGRVEEYERYRLRYPVAVVDILVKRCGLVREHLVADVGAGTGMLAELFLEYGNAVVAVEPNDEMRSMCERRASAWPGLLVVKATAEATGLEAASVDFVAVGRAWHWFDREQALREFRRILRPGGWVVLVTNRRMKDASPEAKEYEAILMEHGTDYSELQSGYRVYDDLPPLFDGGAVVQESLPGEQRLTLEEFLGQTQSLSVAPMPDDPKFPAMQQALCGYFERYQHEGVLGLATACSVFACQLPEQKND